MLPLHVIPRHHAIDVTAHAIGWLDRFCDWYFVWRCGLNELWALGQHGITSTKSKRQSLQTNIFLIAAKFCELISINIPIVGSGYSILITSMILKMKSALNKWMDEMKWFECYRVIWDWANTNATMTPILLHLRIIVNWDYIIE